MDILLLRTRSYHKKGYCGSGSKPGILVHRIFTFSSVFPHDRSTEFSLLFLLFPLPLSFGNFSSNQITTCQPYWICCSMDTYGPRGNFSSNQITTRRSCMFVPGQLLENFSSNQITTLISTSNQITTYPTEFSLIFSDFLEEFVCPETTSRELLVQSDHETYIPAQSVYSFT